jgi:hypothetical protein
MSARFSPEELARFSRPQLDRAGPIRTAGGLYRTAESGQGALGGVPLTAAEDAVVAAVRMAYRVADAQVDRSARLAQRLRDAGDRAVGPRSDRQALDASEKLVFKSLMGALAWLEAAAAQGDTPLRRILVAQYKMLGSLFGLTTPTGHATEFAGQAAEAAGRADGARRGRHGPGDEAAAVRIVLKGEVKRPVWIRRWRVAASSALTVQVSFYNGEKLEHELKGVVAIDAQGAATLTLSPDRQTPSGRWRGAVCDAADVQIGVVEIEL